MDADLQLKLIMGAAACFILGKSFFTIRRGKRSESWRRVQAVVLTSGIDREGGNYLPKIIYKYEINGREYTDDNYTFVGTSGHSKASSLAASRRHPEGSVLTVFVNPNDLTQSVIIPGVHRWHYLYPVFAVAVVVGLAFIVDILNFIWPGCQPNCA